MYSLTEMNKLVRKNLEDLESQLNENYLFMLVFFIMTGMFIWFLYKSMMDCIKIYSNYVRMHKAASPKDTKRIFDGEDYPGSAEDEVYLDTNYNDQIMTNLKTRSDSEEATMAASKAIRVAKNPDYKTQTNVDISTLSRDYDAYAVPMKPSKKGFWYTLTHPS